MKSVIRLVDSEAEESYLRKAYYNAMKKAKNANDETN